MAREGPAPRPARVDGVFGGLCRGIPGRWGVPSDVAPARRTVFRPIAAAPRTVILPVFSPGGARRAAGTDRARPEAVLTSAPAHPSHRNMSGEGGFNDEAYDRGMQEL